MVASACEESVFCCHVWLGGAIIEVPVQCRSGDSQSMRRHGCCEGTSSCIEGCLLLSGFSQHHLLCDVMTVAVSEQWSVKGSAKKNGKKTSSRKRSKAHHCTAQGGTAAVCRTKPRRADRNNSIQTHTSWVRKSILCKMEVLW